MKIFIKILLCLLIFAFPLSLISYAHSGRTDANGGHYDRTTGEYHYHHGFPAHQHPNGICPYLKKKKNTKKNNSSMSFTEYIINKYSSSSSSNPKSKSSKNKKSSSVDVDKELEDTSYPTFELSSYAYSHSTSNINSYYHSTTSYNDELISSWVSIIFLIISIGGIVLYNVLKRRK